MQLVRQARNRVAHPLGRRQPVGNGPAIGVERLVQFPAQADKLGTGEQVPGPQVARQAVQRVGLGATVHAARVHPQRLGHRHRGVPLAGHEQHRDRDVPRLAPAGTWRLLQ